MADRDAERPSISQMDDDRRKFLAACGKFAVVTPPAISLLLSTSLNSKAVAMSGGKGYERHGDRDDRHEHHEHHEKHDKDHDGPGWW